MTFNHHQYNTQYVLNARGNGEPINDAEQKYAELNNLVRTGRAFS